MGRVFLVELEGSYYRCKFCDTPLALPDDLLSRGRAYLFKNVVNVNVGEPEERMMLSGLHTVEDLYCCCCGQLLGWKYIIAREKNQKYKEGKFVLERWTIFSEEFNWEPRPGSSDAESP